MKVSPTGRSIRLVVCLILSVIAVLAAFGQRPLLKGDGVEYVLQTQAFAFYGSAAIPVEEIIPFFNATNPYGHTLSAAQSGCSGVAERCQAGGGFGSLYRTPEGRYLYVHSPMYSLIVAPVYWLLHHVDPSHAMEYRAFRIVNVILFLTVVFAAASLWAAFIAAFLSPLLPYLAWDHPEIFQWSCLTGAFLLSWRRSRLAWSVPLLAGLAASQNFPILVFLLPLWLAEAERWRPATLARYAAGTLLGLIFPIFTLYQLGTFSPIASLGHTDPSFTSFSKALSFVASPSIGALWTYPGLFLLGAVVLFKDRTLQGWLILALSTLLVVAMTTMANMNSAMEGSSRYFCWILAPWFGLVLSRSWDMYVPWQRLCITAAVAAVFLILARARIVADDVGLRVLFARRLEDVASIFYPAALCLEDPEVLYERAMHGELRAPHQFREVLRVATEDGDLWIVPRRALKRGERRPAPYSRLPSYTSCPSQRVFVQQGARVMLRPPEKLTFAVHPVLGRYLVVLAHQDDAGPSR